MKVSPQTGEKKLLRAKPIRMCSVEAKMMEWTCIHTLLISVFLISPHCVLVLDLIIIYFLSLYFRVNGCACEN